MPSTTESIIIIYQNLKNKYEKQALYLSKKHFRLGLFRLICIIIAVIGSYYYYDTSKPILLVITAAMIIVFFYLRKIQAEVAEGKSMAKALVAVNEEEIKHLDLNILSSADGVEFHDLNHAYAADLDLFGAKSLFQYLNRTATHMGKSKLAEALLQLVSFEEIKNRQEAVHHLSEKLDERQFFYAAGKVANDNKESYHSLLKWSQTKEKPLSKIVIFSMYILPAALIIALLLYFFLRDEIYWTIASRLFPINVMFFFFLLKRIKSSISGIEQVKATLHSYATLLNRIEKEDYNLPYLKSLQNSLFFGKTKASEQIQKLSKICNGMEMVQNPIAAIAMNGLYLYHIHNLQRLINWKNEFALKINDWLKVIGAIEMLHSMANFKYNNPEYCFAELNNNYHISFQSIGHPLIHPNKRVCNDSNFENKQFVILTGSNMSGKSTFLRTLGINMVLAGMGSVICATAANIHPLPVYVSMRQSDSLSDSESYFFAEVKRLKYIIDALNQEPSFVLLDEILRGTNSDDKRSGTIGVIEKIIKTKAIGVIATHDLEVCLTTNKYPDTLSNKCFEVAIIADELVFDYKLRAGICQNKSATFLMKKMEII